MSVAITGKIRRVASVVLLSAGLGACSFFQGELMQGSFWASNPFKSNDEAELGIANLAKGNYVAAEGNFQRALKRNPKDIHALLGAGILYQNTGQLTKAREMYEAVLAIRPDESQQFVVWSNISTRPASQIASVNLSLLDSGDVTGAIGAAGTRGGPSAMTAPVPHTPKVSSAPSTSAMLGRPPQMSAPMPRSGAALPSVPSIGKFAGGDSNVISRFATIRALRDQGLLTQQEFNSRRRANIGALLPLTAPPPSAGLDRPVPSTEQITGRLRAIGRALEMRAISVTQHAAERNMILDALMPSAPVVVANPKAPPHGLMEAADSVRRLEQLRDTGYIGSDEYAKERQAIELVMQPKQPERAPVAQTSPAAQPGQPVRMQKSTGPSPAIHLASFRTRKSADRGWAQIRRAHKNLIGDLDHKITKVNLGRKGTYYRLKAGPFESAGEAKSMCGKLKRRRQFCEATVME
ncbi:MAG: SPOR domain-containing protein [Rhodospirillales bacterium]|nr:SPOR domain-containing protein [Alphaproteobacteria bacterium]MBL6947881.1 SPOR domain-containing protein [Rhodospirillales bacterium]